MKDILHFFGGKCEYGYGSHFSTNEKNRVYFEIKISDSETLEKFVDYPGIAASNVAYRFYRNLNEQEKKKYTYIKTILTFKSGIEYKAEFNTWELGIVDNKAVLASKVVEIIKNKKYELIAPLLNDTSIFKYNKQELIDNIIASESQLSNINNPGFEFCGYKFNPVNNKGKDVLHISGLIIRENLNHEFSIDVDPYSEKDEIILLHYKL